MPKILQAYGEPGKHVEEWNWCKPDEPVSIRGFVCANECDCGCGRSFTGCRTSKATSRAKVVAVTFDELMNVRELLRKEVLRGWANSEEIANAAVKTFEETCDLLAEFPTGMVLAVKKRDNGFELKELFCE